MTPEPRPSRRTRLAIVISHPIQHFVPFYRAIAADPDIDLHVFFCSKIGMQSYFDKSMNTEIRWAMDLTGGYPHSFLSNADNIKSSTPRSVVNFDVFLKLKTFEPDVILSYGYTQITQLFVLFYAVLTRTPILNISDNYNKTRELSWKTKLRTILVSQIYKRYSSFLTVGDQNEQGYRELGVPGSRLFRSPFTIDEKTYLAARNQRRDILSAKRSELGLSTDIIFLFVGKIDERKRPALLIEATRRLIRAGCASFHVVLAGNGAQLETLRMQAQAEGLPVTFLGFVNVDALPSIYAMSDVLVHCAGRDPHPLTLSEAAAIGLPMVVSDSIGAVGPTDIAQSDTNALVFKSGDVDDLARQMRRLIDDSDLCRRMSAASRDIYDTSQNTAASLRGLKAALAAVRR